MTPLLEKIKNSGFTIELDDDNFVVTPSEKLTDQQRLFLKLNQEQIITELLLTTVCNPNGVPMQMQARDAQHQAWLIRANQKQSES